MARSKKRRKPSSTICRAILAALVLLLGLAAAGTALAETPEERARVLFREANQLFARKMYLDALEKYRQARAVFPSYKIDLNIGATLDALGRRTEAAVYVERFLLQSALAPEDIIAAAREQLKQLRGKLGRVKVTTLLEGATILADGVSVGTAPLSIPVYMEPGRHRLEARKEGARSSSRTITLTAGQELGVDLSSPEATAGAPATRAAASVPSPALPASAPVISTATLPVRSGPDPVLVARRRKKTVWAWTSLAAGGAFLVAASVLYGVGAAEAKSAHDTYSQLKEPTKVEQAWGDVESGNRKVIAGHVLIGVAAVGIGISLYQFFSRPRVEERPAAARLKLIPLAAGAALHGSF